MAARRAGARACSVPFLAVVLLVLQRGMVFVAVPCLEAQEETRLVPMADFRAALGEYCAGYSVPGSSVLHRRDPAIGPVPFSSLAVLFRPVPGSSWCGS